jgi:hypothetical protein
MSQHTPGPWIVTDRGSNGGTTIRTTKGDLSAVARIYYAAPYFGKMEEDSEANRQANAALIAAAPDLLEACKVALGTLNTMMDIERTRTELAAVIAKAEGR